MIEETLKKCIEKSGLSRYQISISTGVEQSALSRFMSGERTINLQTAEKLMKFFDLQVTKKKRKPRKSGGEA